MCGANPTYMEALGTFLGYKSCCVQGFDRNWNMGTRRKYESGPWSGSGHIPCVDCADVIMSSPTGWAAHVQLIAQARKASVPFPAGHRHEQARLDVELRKYLEELGLA